MDCDFTFDQNGGSSTPGGTSFHLTSTYGGDENLLQALANSLGVIKVQSANDTFGLAVYPFFDKGPNATIAFHLAQSPQTPSMYVGYLGQPGSRYTMDASGYAFLTQCTASTESDTVLFQYEITLQMVDERGFVQEGWGAFVGVDPCNPKSAGGSISVEYAQPRLRVKSWEVKLTNTEPGKPGFESQYTFSGTDGSDHLWMDRQALSNLQDSSVTASHTAERGETAQAIV